jgi:hypothetical protein
MSEDDHTTYKVITLKGRDNYEDWKLSVLSVLLSKDLLDFISVSKATTDVADKRKAGKCFALIIQSLSPVITLSLPADCQDPLDPKAALLWVRLRRTFWAQVGARQATLVQELFRTTIPEGKDSMVHLSKLQSAHSQLNSGGENLSDKMLAYAMTIALPESWSTQKQSLWLHKPLKSKSVASAVRAEWQRRVLKSGGTGTALKVQGNRPQHFNNRSNSGSNNNQRIYPHNDNAYCKYHGMKGHTTESCVTRKRAAGNNAKNKPQAQVAQAKDIPTAQVAKLDVNHDSDGAAYITAASPTISIPSPLLHPYPAVFIMTLVRPTT